MDCLLERVSVDALFSGEPVRTFRWYRGRQFYSGWYWSATTDGMVVYESRLELARILLADFDRDVVSIAAQPFVLSGLDRGRARRHVPDLLLRNTSGLVTVVDVKPEYRLTDPGVREVFDWTGSLVSKRGWAFEVWSGAGAALLDNVRFLAGYRRRVTVDLSLIPAALDAIAGRTQVLGDLERSAGLPAHLFRPVLLHLLWQGILRTDLHVALSARSPIWAADTGAGA